MEVLDCSGAAVLAGILLVGIREWRQAEGSLLEDPFYRARAQIQTASGKRLSDLDLAHRGE